MPGWKHESLFQLGSTCPKWESRQESGSSQSSDAMAEAILKGTLVAEACIDTPTTTELLKTQMTKSINPQ